MSEQSYFMFYFYFPSSMSEMNGGWGVGWGGGGVQHRSENEPELLKDSMDSLNWPIAVQRLNS